MQLFPVSVDEVPKGRGGGTTATQQFLQDFLNSGEQAARVQLEPDEVASNERMKLVAAIEKNEWPIRVTSQGVDGETRLFIKIDEEVLPKIRETKARKAEQAEKAKAERKAAKAEAKANGTADAEVDADEEAPAKRGRTKVSA